nr:AMP-binding protein [Angustibacter aerolatus]
MGDATTGAWRAAHDRSLRDPEGFWGEAARLVDWVRRPTQVLDRSTSPLPRWFPDARLNTCFNALDRHVIAGRADQPALIHDSPVTGTVRTITYAEPAGPHRAVRRALRALGVGVGDRVVVYMPMVPEAVVAMLACARLGAVHSVVFGGFAPAEPGGPHRRRPADRRRRSERRHRAEPHGRVPAAAARRPRPQHPPARVGRGAAAAAGARRGRPGLVRLGRRHQGGRGAAGGVRAGRRHRPAVRALHERDDGPAQGHRARQRWSRGGAALEHDERVRRRAGPGVVHRERRRLGRRPLLHRLRAAAHRLHDRALRGQAGRHAGRRGVLAGGRAARGVGGVHRADGDPGDQAGRPGRRADGRARPVVAAHPVPGRRAARPRHLPLGGERLGVPVVDNWWQTETGWPICASPRGLDPLPVKPGSPSVPMPGYDVRVLDPAGQEVPPGTEGAICLRLPLPPGTLPTLWHDDERMVASYLSAHEGYYLSGDGGYVDEDGYVFVMGRTDDVLNVAGHRLSTGALEAAIAGHPAVAECAVIGVADEPAGAGAAGARRAEGRRLGRRDGGRRVRAAGTRRGRCRRRAEAGRRGGRAAEDPLGQGAAPHDARDRRRRQPRGARHHRGRRGARRARRRAALVTG